MKKWHEYTLLRRSYIIMLAVTFPVSYPVLLMLRHSSDWELFWKEIKLAMKKGYK